MHTDLKFFTNEPDRDLYTRFTKILQGHTQFFDVLVGYFRASGFFKLYRSLESVEKIRILIGLDTDKFTVKIIDRANDELKYATLTEKEGIDNIENQIQEEFETATTSSEVEKGVRVFIDWLKSGKLEMRMFTEAPIHAKVYIMRKDPAQVPDQFGSVITGSSNFSAAGLLNNLEFNVELKDAADVQFALLNSKLADWYIRQLGVTRNGGYFEYKPMFIEKLPVPFVDDELNNRLSKYVDAVMANKQSGTDTSTIENEIDNIIYSLYDLNLEEIAFIKNQ